MLAAAPNTEAALCSTLPNQFTAHKAAASRPQLSATVLGDAHVKSVIKDGLLKADSHHDILFPENTCGVHRDHVILGLTSSAL